MFQVRKRFNNRREHGGETYLKIPGLRYGMSGSATMDEGIPTAMEWTRRVELQLEAFQTVHKEEAEWSSKEQSKKKGASSVASEYAKLEELDKRFSSHAKKIIEPLKKCGDLGGSHYIGLAAAIGLLPFWMLHHIGVSNGSNTKKLADHFNFEATMQNAKSSRRALAHVFTHDVLANCELPGDRAPPQFRSRLPKKMCFRCTENVECKYCRFCLSKNNSDAKHGDLHVRGQFLVNIMYEGIIRVFDPNSGNSVDCESALFPTWTSDGHSEMVYPVDYLNRLDKSNLYGWLDERSWRKERRQEPLEPDFCNSLRKQKGSQEFYLRRLGIVQSYKSECRDIYMTTQREILKLITDGRTAYRSGARQRQRAQQQNVGWESLGTT